MANADMQYFINTEVSEPDSPHDVQVTCRLKPCAAAACVPTSEPTNRNEEQHVLSSVALQMKRINVGLFLLYEWGISIPQD